MHVAFSILKWLVIFVFVLALIIAAFVFLVPQSWLRHVAGERASQQLGRTFTIDGDIHVDWDWTTPYVHLGQVRLGNTEGAKEPHMVDIEELNFHIKMWNLLKGELNLPDIDLVKPRIILEKYEDGKKNWDLPTLSKAKVVSETVLPSQRSNFPMLDVLLVEGGQMEYRDDKQDLDIKLAIDGVKGTGVEAENGYFKLVGNGTLQKQDFKLDAEGGSLAMLRNSTEDYPLQVHIVMGKTDVEVKGTFQDPVKMSNIDATLDIHGDNLADLFYLTAIPLPPSSPYQLSGHLLKKDDTWTFEQFKGQVGKSDLSGHLVYDTSGERGFAKAELTSISLRMEDLSGFIGAQPVGTDTVAAQPTPADKPLLPNIPINLERLRATDLEISFKAGKIDQPGWPLDDLEAQLNLKDGVLHIDPFSFGVADGKISGPLVFDGSKEIPHVSTDLSLHRLALKPFFSDSRFESFSTGHFGGRIAIEGDGRSLAEVFGHSNGRITMMMAGGTLSKLVVAAAGLDLGQAAPALLGKDETTGLRCAIGDFKVTDGKLGSDIFVIDTTMSNIHGMANINLKDESIEARIEAQPKEASVTAHTPITIDGKLRHPSIGIDPKEIAARGAIAAALSAVATPLAGILPFIEPGLGKDSDCQGLIQAAGAHSGTTPPPAEPQNAPTPAQ